MSFFKGSNFKIEFNLARISNRIYALILDYLNLSVALFLSIAITILFQDRILNSVVIDPDSANNLIRWLWATEILIISIIYIGYFIIFETIWLGQTPGKKRANIRVVSDDGKPVELPKTTLRALFRPLDDFFLIGIVFIILGKRKQRIGDILAGTVVIKDKNKHKISQKKSIIYLSPEAKIIADLIILKTDLNRLSIKTRSEIDRYLQQRDLMSHKCKIELARYLALEVKGIIELDEIPHNVTANLFLEAIYVGYHRLQ